MVDSETLGLLSNAEKMKREVYRYVTKNLKSAGFSDISPSSLYFLASLECGDNYASEIARSLQVSRQMVSKTVKALVEIGYLELKHDKGKQKTIVFTQLGEELISSSRKLLESLDDSLLIHHSRADLTRFNDITRSLIALVNRLD